MVSKLTGLERDSIGFCRQIRAGVVKICDAYIDASRATPPGGQGSGSEGQGVCSPRKAHLSLLVIASGGPKGGH